MIQITQGGGGRSEPEFSVKFIIELYEIIVSGTNYFLSFGNFAQLLIQLYEPCFFLTLEMYYKQLVIKASILVLIGIPEEKRK